MEECKIFIERHFMERHPIEKDFWTILFLYLSIPFYTFGLYHLNPSFLYDILASSLPSMVK